ncbi:hypothetical protein GQR58_024923 [Nymphon striatum]|nr:hypothetical protein GQR58_024923 [Nymphon striatum]
MHHYAKFQRPICKDAPVYSEQTHTPFWPPFWIQYGDDTQDPHGSLSYIIMHHYAKFQRPICKDAPVFNKLLNEKKKKIITHNENTPVRPSFRSVEKIVSRNRLYKRTALLPLPKPDPNPLLTPDTLLVPQPAHPTYPTPKHSRAKRETFAQQCIQVCLSMSKWVKVDLLRDDDEFGKGRSLSGSRSNQLYSRYSLDERVSLLPEKIGTSLICFKGSHSVLTINHYLTISPYHHITISPSHHLTISPSNKKISSWRRAKIPTLNLKQISVRSLTHTLVQAGHIGRIPSTSSRDVACCAKHCSGDQKLANLGQHVASLQAPSLCLLR